MLSNRCRRPYNYLANVHKVQMLVPLPVAVAAASTAATPTTTALPAPATTGPAPALFGFVAAFAVDWAIAARFKRHRGRLPATGANDGSPGTHPGPGTRSGVVMTAVMLSLRWAITAATAARTAPTRIRTLFRLTAWFAAPR
jgi:hypothetical protein